MRDINDELVDFVSAHLSVQREATESARWKDALEKAETSKSLIFDSRATAAGWNMSAHVGAMLTDVKI